TAPRLEDAADLYEVRASMESLVARRFVERATDAEVADLAAAVEEFALAAESGRVDDIRGLLGTKDRFYTVLIAGARSAALQQLLEGIQARVQVLRATSLSESGRLPQAVQELRDIAAAIADRDADLAARLCAEHVRAAAATAMPSLRGEEP